MPAFTNPVKLPLIVPGFLPSITSGNEIGFGLQNKVSFVANVQLLLALFLHQSITHVKNIFRDSESAQPMEHSYQQTVVWESRIKVWLHPPDLTNLALYDRMLYFLTFPVY